MRVTIADRHTEIGHRLREKLDHVAQLRCEDHDLPVTSVAIDARENGWFDSRYTTCCERLETRAAAILGTRCR
jgi:hypothetical protein